MSENRGLGRGIDALFGGDLASVLSDEDKSRVRQILIQDVTPDPRQPRRQIDEVELAGLAASIERHGILQPLIVVSSDNGKYQIVAGERRWRAAQKLGLSELPAIVRTLKELERLEIALIENVQRVDLSPFEQALSINRLKSEFNVDHKEIAKRLGKAETTVYNLVRLLNLPKAAIKALQDGKISEGHARAILSLDSNVKSQEELLSLILKGGWTVRQAEKFAAEHKTKPSRISKNRIDNELSKKLGYKVSVEAKKRGGIVAIAYKNDAELAKLKKLLLK